MAKAVKKIRKQRKPQKRKKQSITKLLILGLKKFSKQLIYSITKKAYANPLISIGFFLFLCFTSFFSYHVIFNQNLVARNFFFSTNTKKENKPTLTIESLINDQSKNQISTNKNAISFQQSQDIQNFSNKMMNSKQLKPFIVVPGFKPTPLSNNKNLTSIENNKIQQIMKVQAALRFFGSKELIINGISDERTKEAILAFQKMFMIKEDGTINKQLLNKMREVGLLEKDALDFYYH